MRSSGQLNRITEALQQEAAATHASESALSPTAAPRQEETGLDAAPSPWLYLAGLLVTLSGLYAVNYNLEDTGFAFKTYAIAIAGYVVSYLVRRGQIRIRALRLPLLALLALALFAWLPFGHPSGEITGHLEFEDRSRGLQLLFVGVSLLHTFMLTTDASVLFACVPCMTMIALVSTTNSGSEVQNAFLCFIGAATFLMVHENFLRTRTVSTRTPPSHFRLLSAQMQIVAVCFLCALALANVVAVPIRTLGESLPGTILPQTSGNSRAVRSVRTLLSNDSQSIEIATGPVAESDMPVMRVRSPRGFNWRGTTYDFYTGVSFENQLKTGKRLLPPGNFGERSRDVPPSRSWRRADRGFQGSASFTIPQGESQLPINAMQGAQVLTQHVTILSDGLSQVYGAGDPLVLTIPYIRGIFYYPSGSVLCADPLPAKIEYDMQSVVPTDDKVRLRAAPSAPSDYPAEIRERYLQRSSRRLLESDKLRSLAESITAGLTNNYDRAVAIRDYIAANCKYNLQASAAPADADRVEHFMTVSREGYCDSFAASMALLCRYVNIPTRVAAGYLAGEHTSDGTFLVRQKDKHAWTEVFFPKIGWVTFDATDGAQDISNHTIASLSGRTTFFKWLAAHGWLPPLLLGCLVVLLIYVAVSELLPRVRVRSLPQAAAAMLPEYNAEIARNYQEACRLLARRGLARAGHTTPDEYASQAAVRLGVIPEASAALQQLTELHERFRYGQETAVSGDVDAARSCVGTLENSLRRLPKSTRNLALPASS